VRILVLGGTKFLGRAFVEAALAAGHEPTLFTRGRTNPGLFPGVERVEGDRERDLDALANRTWDAVVDTSTFLPRVAALSADALHDRVGRYLYVSSISAYADLSVPATEESALATDAPDESAEHYGALKAACEKVVLDRYGDRALVVRPGLIVGPHDPTGRFTYWALRLALGGTVLAPGRPDDLKQFIDVRDLAGWMLRMLEGDEGGVYNATGQPIPFGELLAACNGDARLVWVPSEELVGAGVGEWMELPLWIASPEFAAMQQVDVSKAIAAGLTFRPLEETVRATIAEAELVEGVGLDPERERELLAGR
jgi:2'-hydroxyisoflavone reductase